MMEIVLFFFCCTADLESVDGNTVLGKSSLGGGKQLNISAVYARTKCISWRTVKKKKKCRNVPLEMSAIIQQPP